MRLGQFISETSDEDSDFVLDYEEDLLIPTDKTIEEIDDILNTNSYIKINGCKTKNSATNVIGFIYEGEYSELSLNDQFALEYITNFIDSGDAIILDDDSDADIICVTDKVNKFTKRDNEGGQIPNIFVYGDSSHICAYIYREGAYIPFTYNVDDHFDEQSWNPVCNYVLSD